MWEAFLEIAGGFTTFSLLTITSQAVKYMVDKTFDKVLFWKTNVKPFFWTFIAGIVIALYSVFLPDYTIFLETLSGGKIDTSNMALLFGSASIFGAVLKAMIGKPTEVAKLEMELDNRS